MVEVLVDKLVKLDIRIGLAGEDSLKIYSDVSRIPVDVLAEIRQMKHGLIDYLKGYRSAEHFAGIPQAPLQASYPLSATQRRIWILSQFEQSNAAYNLSRSYVFNGDLDRNALTSSYQTLLQRHEILRTVFRKDSAGDIRQFIHDDLPAAYRIHFHLYVEDRPSQEMITRAVEEEYLQAFDLAEGPLLRINVFAVAPGEWVLTYVMHHIISDGWSMDILMGELMQLYNASVQNLDIRLPPLKIQYKDYSVWQQEQLSHESLQRHRNYWLQKMTGELPVLDLFRAGERPAVKTYRGAAIYGTIDAQVCEGLKQLGRDNGCTLFMTVLAAVDALFYRYSGQRDIIIGTPMAGRQHVDLEGQIGFYVNTIALRVQFENHHGFRQLLDIARQTIIEGYEHQIYPFDLLVDDLDLPVDRSRHPLFDIQVIVSEMNERRQGGALDKLSVSSFSGVGTLTTVFDAVFQFAETAGGMEYAVIYNTDCYTERDIRQLLVHLERLMAALIADPDSPVGSLEFLTGEETKWLLDGVSSSRQAYPGSTLVELFERQAEKTPDAIAVVFEGHALRYGELNEKASRLAHYLRTEYGIAPNELVGLMVDRSEWMVIGILGILRSGGAYVPVDPFYPPERKAYICNDARIRVLITQTAYLMDLTFYSGPLIALDVQLDQLASPVRMIPAEISYRDLAYVIYTSGSTGMPKGVMVEHAGVANTVCAQAGLLQAHAGDRHLQFASMSFDASVSEIFVALCSGSRLYIAPEEKRSDPEWLSDFIRENEIGLATLPPVFVRRLDFGKLGRLTRLITAGEAADPDRAEAFSRQGQYFNGYGPTECSICVSMHRCDPGQSPVSRSVPLGIPLPNIQLYILDDEYHLLPPGAVGEICVSGIGLARGYWMRPELTAEKFIDHPYREGQRLYRTGDLGRWLPDGNLEFMGRKDEQMKIRGFRIEPGEIELALCQFDGIAAAVIADREVTPGGGRELVAYVVPATGHSLHMPAIREHLGRLLPAYMLPAYFVSLEALPVTAHGKVDRRRLPDDPGQYLQAATEYLAPRTDVEVCLVKIWKEVLNKDQVGIRDDFFEMGGSSLKAMVIVKRMMDEAQLKVSLRAIFEQRTIEKISARLEKELNDTPSAQGDDWEEHVGSLYDLSYNQLTWFSGWTEKGDHTVVTAYEFPQLEPSSMTTAIGRLIERHEILRTVFIHQDGGVRQKVLAKEACHFEELRMQECSEEEWEAIEKKEYDKTLDTASFPLFKIGLYRLPRTCQLLVTVHHAIIDGYSWGILREELMELYTAILEEREPRLNILPYQYRDFAAWQRAFVASTEGQRHRQYWWEKLKGFRTGLTSLPPEEGDICMIQTSLKGDRWTSVERYAKKNGTGIAPVLLATMILALHFTYGQNDITIYMPVSGRNSRYYKEMDINGLIGFFANLLLVRCQVDPAWNIVDFLRKTRTGLLEDLDHDSYPFGKLAPEVTDGRPEAFFDGALIFNYHNYDYNKKNSPQFATEEQAIQSHGKRTTRVAFGLDVTEYDRLLGMKFIFNDSLYPMARREAMIHLYFSILEQVLSRQDMAIGELK